MRIAGLLVLALVAVAAVVARPAGAPSTPARASAGGSPTVAVAVQPVHERAVAMSCMREQPVVGVATYFAEAYDGQAMANGETFDMHDPTITASNHWPLGTRLAVRRLPGSPWDRTLSPQQITGFLDREIVVTVTDRGDFDHPLDLSLGAFGLLGQPREGVIRVAVQPLACAEDTGHATALAW